MTNPPKPTTNQPNQPTPHQTLSILGLIETAGYLLPLATIAALLGPYHWTLDLFSHFRPQYLAGSILLIPLFALRRKKLLTILFTTTATINLIILTPHWITTKTKPNPPKPTQLRALWWNVQTAKQNRKPMLNWIQQQNPDLIALAEITPEWKPTLRHLKKTHPYELTKPRWDNFGIGIYSRLPLNNSKILTHRKNGIPTLQTQIHLAGKTIQIIATHPLPPTNKQNTKDRNTQLNWLAQHIKTTHQPTILLGDLNTTPWNHTFKKLITTSKLQSTPGFFTTWPTHLYPLRIPIDHCLTTKDIQIQQRQTGPPFDSDHAPLTIQLTW